MKETKTTKKEIAKNEILSILNAGGSFTTGELHKKISESHTLSIDTIRTAVKGLSQDKAIQHKVSGRTINYFVEAPKMEIPRVKIPMALLPAPTDEERVYLLMAPKRKIKVDTIQPLPIDKSKKGWKMNLARAWFANLEKGCSFPRRKLAIACKTDERNMHIMVSKMKKKGELSHIEYDRKTRTYKSIA